MTGLVAALRLSRAGASVVLVEATDRPGGQVGTLRDDGYLVEDGPDGFVADKGPVMALIAELGLGDHVIQPRSRGSSILWEGRLSPLPEGMGLMVPTRLGPFLGSDLLTWRGRWRALCDLALPRGSGGDESLESLVARRLGAEMLERVAGPMIGGIHGADPAQMSVEASFPRLLEMERDHRSLILAARARGGDGGGFASLSDGMGILIDALLAAMPDVRLIGKKALVVETGTGAARTTLEDGDVLVSEGVVVALPAKVASEVLSATPETALLGTIVQTPSLTVTLSTPTDDLPDLHGTGFVVPRAQTRAISGATYSSRKWPGRVGDPETTLIRVFLSHPFPTDPVPTVVTELGTILGRPVRPSRTWVRHIPAGLHVYAMGHIDRLATVERALPPNVVLAGAGFHGVGLNECLDSGERAARRLVGSLIGDDD
ncbi:MAG: protoporphyrinogen oxidase [Actinobacteria bacterium]|nr:protoporphyrinogen oxidase [Actinomycetota bacterium]